MKYSIEKIEKGKQLPLTNMHNTHFERIMYLVYSILFCGCPNFALHNPVRSYLKHVLYCNKNIRPTKHKALTNHPYFKKKKK